MRKMAMGFVCALLGIIHAGDPSGQSITYSTSDRYNSGDYACTIRSVSSVYDLRNIDGVHSSTIKSDMAYLNNSIAVVINISRSGSLLASGYIFKGHGDSDPWNRLVIMADGFDPLGERRVNEVTTEANFKTLFNVSGDGNTYPLVAGYDIMFVDFKYGGDDIRNNAKAFLKILEEANKRTKGPIFAGGLSMGGYVSRLALLYGQKDNAMIDHVKKYIAVDSPLQGASGLPISLQRMVYESRHDSPDAWKMVNTLAAQQMLYEHIRSQNGYATEHDKFQTFLKNMGNYPEHMVRYSVANANWTKPYTASSVTYKVDLDVDYQVWGGYCPIPPTCGVDVCYIDKEKTINWATIVFSGHDLAAGSYNDVVSVLNKGVDEEAKPYNILLKLESSFLDLIGKTSSALTGCTMEYNSASLSRSITLGGFVPTHVPVYSAFDLRGDTPASLKNSGSLEVLSRQGWTPFDKLYLCSSRHEHIQFTPQMCGIIVKILNDDSHVSFLQPLVDYYLSD